MIAKLQLIRSASIEGERGLDFGLKHPLTGLAVAACYDSLPTTTPPAGVYSALAGLGFPQGAGVLPSTSGNYAFQGICVVGPNGPVPFVIKSAQHRVQAACTYQIPVELPGPPPALTSSKTAVLHSTLWRRNPLDLYNAYTGTTYRPMTGGSIFASDNGDVAAYDVAPENNSFATNNAIEYNVPGYTTISRNSQEEEVTSSLLATINESIRYRQAAKGLGRFLSVENEPLNLTAMNFYQTNVFGTYVTHNSAGVVQSLWEIEIADDVLQATAGLGGQLYAICAGAVPSAWFNCEEWQDSGGTTTFLGQANASPYFDSGEPKMLYVNLTNPLSQNAQIFDGQVISLFNQIGGAASGAYSFLGSRLGLQGVTDKGVSQLF